VGTSGARGEKNESESGSFWCGSRRASSQQGEVAGNWNSTKNMRVTPVREGGKVSRSPWGETPEGVIFFQKEKGPVRRQNLYRLSKTVSPLLHLAIRVWGESRKATCRTVGLKGEDEGASAEGSGISASL